MALELHKLSHALGAEVCGVDVSRPMTEACFGEIIEYLNKHATRFEHIYRHQWRQDDIIVWDNRCTMHLALGDFDETQRRHMERTTVLGTPSGYVVENA